MIDTTPEAISLTGFEDILPGEYLTVLDPEGMQNNNGRVVLYDIFQETEFGGFSYGNWPGNNTGIPDGNAHGLYDESLSRFPNGLDNFVKTYATPGNENVPSPGGATLLGVLGAGMLISSRRKRSV